MTCRKSNLLWILHLNVEKNATIVLIGYLKMMQKQNDLLIEQTAKGVKLAK